jgi:hypothetical protein
MSRRRPVVALSFVLAALSGAQVFAAPDDFVPDARTLFAGCKPSADGSNSRFYACAGYSASITHVFGSKELAPPQVVRMMTGALRAMVPPEVQEETFTLALDGKDCSGVRLLPASKKAAEVFGVAEAVVVPLPNGDYRGLLVACQRRDARCDQQRVKVFQYLARKGPPERVTIDKRPELGPPKLLDRTLVVPDGCRLATANPSYGRIECNGSVLSWNVVTAPVPPNPDTWQKETAAQLETSLGGGLTNQRVSCKVEKSPAKCTRLSKQRPDGVLLSYLGATIIGGRGVMVSCTFLQSKEGFPSVCNHTITLE